MPLALGSPLNLGTVDTIAITNVTVRPEDDAIYIHYRRSSAGNPVDEGIQGPFTAAQFNGATGAGMKAKLYSLLATALGVSGTVT